MCPVCHKRDLLCSLVLILVLVLHPFTTPTIASSNQLFSFGSNSYGQLGDGSWSPKSTPTDFSESGMVDGEYITSISAGWAFSLMLSGGEVFSCGANNYGQIGDGSTYHRNVPVAVSTSGVLKNLRVTEISAGNAHILVIADHRVFSWGMNDAGQLGSGTSGGYSSSPVAVSTSGVLGSKKIAAVSAGGFHSLALSTDGKVFSWGQNSDKQLGDGTSYSRSSPVACAGSSGITFTAVAAGGFHSLILSEDGDVYSFGDNQYGQLGQGHFGLKNSLNSDADIKFSAIAAGAFHSLVLSEGSVYAAGLNTNGQLGVGSTLNKEYLTLVGGGLSGLEVTAIAAGGYHSVVLTNEGRVFTFGSGSSGQLGNGASTDRITPVEITSVSTKKITSVRAGGYHTLLLSDPGISPFVLLGVATVGIGILLCPLLLLLCCCCCIVVCCAVGMSSRPKHKPKPKSYLADQPGKPAQEMRGAPQPPVQNYYPQPPQQPNAYPQQAYSPQYNPNQPQPQQAYPPQYNPNQPPQQLSPQPNAPSQQAYPPQYNPNQPPQHPQPQPQSPQLQPQPQHPSEVAGAIATLAMQEIISRLAIPAEYQQQIFFHIQQQLMQYNLAPFMTSPEDRSKLAQTISRELVVMLQVEFNPQAIVNCVAASVHAMSAGAPT